MFDYRLEHIMSYNAKLGEPEVIGLCRKVCGSMCM